MAIRALTAPMPNERKNVRDHSRSTAERDGPPALGVVKAGRRAILPIAMKEFYAYPGGKASRFFLVDFANESSTESLQILLQFNKDINLCLILSGNYFPGPHKVLSRG